MLKLFQHLWENKQISNTLEMPSSENKDEVIQQQTGVLASISRTEIWFGTTTINCSIRSITLGFVKGDQSTCKSFHLLYTGIEITNPKHQSIHIHTRLSDSGAVSQILKKESSLLQALKG